MTAISRLTTAFQSLNSATKTLVVGSIISVVLGTSIVAAISADKGALVPLVSPADNSDVPAVLESLRAEKIRFEIGADGSVMIGRNDLAKARSALTAAGQMFQSSSSGYDLLQQEQSMFLNDTQLQHYDAQIRVGNLIKTLNKIPGVISSEVHLAMSERTEFLRSSKPASASVMLELARDVRLTQSQVQGVAKLVANSTPNLSANDVVITDQFANQLTNNNSDNMSFSSSQREHTTYVENELKRNITNVMAPIFGANNIRVNVVARINYDEVKSTTESYSDEPNPMVSEQVELDFDERYRGGQGVPGATSNQPPGHAEFERRDRSFYGDGNPALRHEKSTRNFEVGRTITQTNFAGAVIESISAVVVVNRRVIELDLPQENPSPEQITEALNQRLQTLELLVESSTYGVNENDLISVVAEPFLQAPAAEADGAEPAEASLFEQLDQTDYIVAGAIALVAALLIAVLVRRRRAQVPEASEGVIMLEGDDTNPVDPETGISEPETSDIDLLKEKALSMFEEKPEASLQIMKAWLSDDDETIDFIVSGGHARDVSLTPGDANSTELPESDSGPDGDDAEGNDASSNTDDREPASTKD
ncbi:flagellar basal-body MS-ring/collar protein FliF [Ferrimonas marina]|uniref:Flagellar M-ring protein n=1 Tax=Ferrimonas marina TaxID=299255 RepID=A0A1M5TF32_9GAMM|nr:flagellar basal-body MS-ring/collar protein FliF [Ferrimonas marina]SHH49319.1 flagellar basal-body M-ring protein/flagellar hook-basal body protein (fliF) [Ferrimonas marina]